MSDSRVTVGPFFDRAVFDGGSRTIRYRMRTVCRFDDVKQLRLREYVAPYEEEQLLDVNPEVEKVRRAAELWVDRKDGTSVKVSMAESSGLLLSAASDAAALIRAPFVTERAHIDVQAAPGVDARAQVS